MADMPTREQLQSIEWAGKPVKPLWDGEPIRTCPACRRLQPNHDADCWLAKAIASAPTGAPPERPKFKHCGRCNGELLPYADRVVFVEFYKDEQGDPVERGVKLHAQMCSVCGKVPVINSMLDEINAEWLRWQRSAGSAPR